MALSSLEESKKPINLNSLNVFVRAIRLNNMDDEHNCPRRKLYDYQMLAVLNGKICFDFPKEKIQLKSGDVIIIPPDIMYQEYLNKNEGCNYFIMHFDLYWSKEREAFDCNEMYFKYCTPKYKEAPYLSKFIVENDPNYGLYDEPIVYRNNRLSIFYNDFTSLIETFYPLSNIDKQIMPLLLNSLVLKVLFNLEHRERLKLANSKYEICDKFVECVEANYASKIDISTFARDNGYSPNYFRRLFITNMNLSPTAFLNKKRMNMAVKLINDDLSIADVARKVGFEDAFYFSKAFKKAYGISPKAFQKREK